MRDGCEPSTRETDSRRRDGERTEKTAMGVVGWSLAKKVISTPFNLMG